MTKLQETKAKLKAIPMRIAILIWLVQEEWAKDLD